MSIIHLNGRKFFTKETVRQLLLLVANWLLLFWLAAANGRYLIGTSSGFLMAGLSLSLLTWVMVYRFRKGILSPRLVAASLVLSVIILWFIKIAHEDHAGPGAGILFFPFLLGLFVAFCADVWGVLKREGNG